MLRWLLWGLAAFAVGLSFAGRPAAAEARIALVIGNGAYAKGPIKTALGDGGLVAEALNSAGFEIVEGADLNQADLRRTFRDFLAKVEAAGPDAIAFVYFSGYGLELEGENYLVPVDARLERDSDIPIDAVRLSDLIRPLAGAPAGAKVIVLDAVRPLPFEIQGARLPQGLAAVDAPPGTLIAMASGPGTVAGDGEGSYGAYATAIAEMVRQPGLDLDAMFTRIRVRTHQVTEGRQTPWHVAALNAQVMLLADASPPEAAPGAPPPPAPVALREQRPPKEVGPEEAYAYAIEQDTLPAYSEYIQVYPQSPYAPRVWAIIRARREALAWLRATEFNTPEAYWTYLRRYPHGIYAFDAERRLARLAAAPEPPPSFALVEFADVPPPLPEEPVDYVAAFYAPAPPPPVLLIEPRPLFYARLPPPRLGVRPGLLPVTVAIAPASPLVKPPARARVPLVGLPPPGGGLRPGGPPVAPGNLPRPGAGTGPAPASLVSPPGGPPPGAPPPGGAQPKVLKKGFDNNPPPGAPPPAHTVRPGAPGAAAVNAPPAGPQPKVPKKGTPGPAFVNNPPPGGPPPAGAGKPPPGPAFVNKPPPGGAAIKPAVINNPPPVVHRPPPVVNRPVAPVVNRPPPQVVNRPPPVVHRPPPVVAPRAPAAPAAAAARKCAVVNGKTVCR